MADRLRQSLSFRIVFAGYGFLIADLLPAAMLASGVLSVIMFAPNLALCADLAPKNRNTTVFAGFNVAGSFGFLFGPLVVESLCATLQSTIGEVQAYRTVLVFTGGTDVACAVITLPFLLRLRRAGLTR